MIDIKKLSFSYDGKRNVLKDLDFHAQGGQLVTVLGPNGAGKSTLFKCILGIYRNYSGEILFNGRDAGVMTRREMAHEAAYIPQSADPVFNYTVFDTVLMGATASLNTLSSPGRTQREAVDNALETLGISHLRYRGIAQISGGERQLALIARALVQNARILIMDEPTANLDFGNQYLVLDTIQKLTACGYSIIMSTHNPDHALRFSTHVLALMRDCRYKAGPAREILNEETIREIYGLPVKITEIVTDEGTFRNCVPLQRR